MDTAKTLIDVWLVCMAITFIAVLCGVAFMRDGIRPPVSDHHKKGS